MTSFVPKSMVIGMDTSWQPMNTFVGITLIISDMNADEHHMPE